MTTIKGAEAVAGGPAGSDPHAKDDAKKAINKAAGRVDGMLDEHQLTRAATEYMVALRPQPAPPDMRFVLTKLVERDSAGKLKLQAKDTDAVPAAVDAALAEAAK